ncbi:MAG: hypothetical protein RIR70_1493 [Pseudomonadota bacterium]
MTNPHPSTSPISRWQDPLRLITHQPPETPGRIVLWVLCILTLGLLAWAAFGELDIVASAEGKLTPETLVKIVQPAQAGVIAELSVNEGQSVRAGQVLARLDPTFAQADHTGVSNDLQFQRLQLRRIEAELADAPMQAQSGDDPARFAEVNRHYQARRKALADSLEQERALLLKAQHEKRAAQDQLAKLEQVLPTWQKSAQAYERLEKQGFIGPLASAEKQREATEKARDLDTQRATVAALDAAVSAQNKKLTQLKSTYLGELQKELALVRERINQLEPALEKTRHATDAMVLRAPQDGVIKDLATTTVGAVVQPGAVLMTLVPHDEALYADVEIRNQDVGFVRVGQRAKIKLAAYPFQRHGMLTGEVILVSADASARSPSGEARNEHFAAPPSAYKARLRLDAQVLIDSQGTRLTLTPGMMVQAEIHQGTRTVLAYLLSPIQKAVQEAGRER